MIKASDLPIGTHFWAKMDDKICVIGKMEDSYQVCGAWECGVDEKYFEVLELIKLPEGHTFKNLYYL